MTTLDELRVALRHHKATLKRKYKVRKIGIFGSYANGSASEHSDVDILVEFDEPIGLDFVLLADELEKILPVQVDLVSKNALKPNIYRYVKEDLVYV